MELAKIRSKSQKGVDVRGEGVQPCTDSLPATAETVPAPLPGQMVTAPVSAKEGGGTPDPLLYRQKQPLEFNPLARIMAGRQQNSDVTIQSEAGRGDEQGGGDAAAGETEEYLCFKLGDEEYGINIMAIKEIIKPRELTEVPRTQRFIEGVISLRGLVVPVFDMRKRLGMPPADEITQERVVVVRSGEGLYGLKVDRITDVVRITAAGREVTPQVLDGVAREFVSFIGRAGERMLIILDIGKVVDTSLEELI